MSMDMNNGNHSSLYSVNQILEKFAIFMIHGS